MKWIYTVFGLGYFPYGPGTITSLSTVIVWAFFPSPALISKILLILVIVLLGLFVSQKAVAELSDPDPSCVVIDEVAGQLVALSMLPHTPSGMVLAFFLFRVFDIKKPWIIADLERLPGGLGIMADDVLAGLFAGFLGQLVLIGLNAGVSVLPHF
ncbi:MAG: phosphatidylglycerophosphatase A family protein [Leptospirillum sp.]|jgi:phosphatidylglycerophosphatase A